MSGVCRNAFTEHIDWEPTLEFVDERVRGIAEKNEKATLSSFWHVDMFVYSVSGSGW